ncbi:5-formyltetrahydrofolate cyclo-ligase [Emticicia fluvialis]|uniref:5-formyltetrahydrofolate cyclo-ligase n=1 Tax=Emticicia fluvialis TaxID=2974474 RepID=UPI0021658C7A|nr:5-formyltetrahydrofolate cyclo-ligase [Emticicia fluvialis]
MNKAALRAAYLQKRKELSGTDSQTYSQRIHDWLFKSFPVHNYAAIHTYLPIKKKIEVDTQLVIDTLKQDFKAGIVVPKSHDDGTMTNYWLKDDTILLENKFGVPEPVNCSPLTVNAQEIDMVLIPLLAFDKRGYRVGYGKGYYDRFLTRCRPDVVKIGVSFFDPVEAIDDVNDTDIKLDYCITPNGIWSF